MAVTRFTYARILYQIRRIIRNEFVVLSVLALVVGAVSGGAVIVFREAIDFIQWGFYGSPTERLSSYVPSLEWWHVLLAPAVGGLMVGLFIRYVVPDGRPKGVADVIEASALKGGRMSMRAGISSAVASAVSIGSGASVGREGPAVHLGATLAGWIGHRLHLSQSLNQTLLGCGVAAAVAASFNAPLAGALFANEVVIGHYALRAFAPIVIASVAGTAISQLHFGNFPAFAFVNHPITSFWEFPAFIMLGVVCGIAAIAMMHSAVVAGRVIGRTPLPVWARPAVAGLAIGAMALVVPQVLGIGYGTTEDALLQNFGFWTLCLMAVAKILATGISLGCGFAGGIFSPALVVGALVGAAYGIVVTAISPELSAGAPAYTVVGMGAVAASVLGAPISTTLIIFEMTDDYTLTLGVMLAVVVSSEFSHLVYDRSFFTKQLKLRGIDLKGGLEQEIMRNITVGKIMRHKNELVPPSVGLQDLRLMLQHSEMGELFVVDDTGKLVGTLTLSDMSEYAFSDDLDGLVNAGDLARRNPPVVSRKDDIETAAALIRDTGEYLIAVVDDRESMNFQGSIRYRDIITAYNHALMDRHQEEAGPA